MAARRLNPEEEMMVASFEMLGLGGSRKEKEKFVLTMPKVEKEEAAMRKEQKREAEAEGGWKSCTWCGKRRGSKRCSACWTVFYCSQECQRNAWREGHKDKCKDVRKKFKEIVLLPIQEVEPMRKMCEAMNKMPESEAVFKAKVTVVSPGSTITIHNKEMTIIGELARLPGQEVVFDKLKRVVEEMGLVHDEVFAAGVSTSSACFYAFNKGPNEEGGWKLEINPEQVQVMWKR